MFRLLPSRRGALSGANVRKTSRRLLFDHEHPDSPRHRSRLHDCVALGLGCTWDIARAARIVKCQFQGLAGSHSLQPHFGVRPVQRTFDAPQIEPNHLADRLHGVDPITVFAYRFARELSANRWRRRGYCPALVTSLARCSTRRITSSLCAPTSGQSPIRKVGTPPMPFWLADMALFLMRIAYLPESRAST